MSTRYEQLLPEVLPYVAECVEDVALNAIRNATIEFCEKSLWWVFEHDPITLVGGTSTYCLNLPDFTTSAMIIDAWYDTLRLTPAGEDKLKRGYAYDWRALTGAPQFYIHDTPNEVIVVPQPLNTEVNALTVIVALKPTRNSVDIDDALYENWAEGIAYGARARLQMLPDQSFSNPQAAMANMAMFNSAVTKAKIARYRGLARAVTNVRPPRFF